MNIPFPDLMPILPEIIITAAASLLLIIELFMKNKGVIGLLAVFTAALVFYAMPMSQGETFGGMFVSDGYSAYFKLIFIINLILTVCISLKYVKREGAEYGEYYSLLLFATAGMMFMASAKDLIILYVGLELMALSTYILAGIKRSDIKSNEAAMKYFLLGAFSSALLLFGISLIYGLTTTTDIYRIGKELKMIIPSADASRLAPILLSMILITAGFAFKIAAAPFHMWAPDVYEGAPTSVTAFMSVGPKAAGFAVIGRVFYMAFPSLQPDWTAILIGIAVITMAAGNIIALSQTNIKRMLAYSSIAHAGYMLLGIIAGSEAGLQSVMTYLLIYAFMNIGAFAIVIMLESSATGVAKGVDISDYDGLAKSHPVISALMLVFMFSLAGLPPTAGFIVKFNLFMAAIKAGYSWLVVIAVIFSAVSAYYYLRVVMNMYMKDLKETVAIHPSSSLIVAIVIALLTVIIIGVFPAVVIG
ncbi:MAG: NADH-quinone oxidoreductase subunit N [Nitrospirae bacterium]|nr:NADH-quinone oxidoreductase subunit N [Nitrospirota bacterium]